MLLTINSLLASRYEVKRFVDSGMSSEIYEVYDIEEKEPKAVKVSNKELMLEREAESAKQISHQNVVKYFEYRKEDYEGSEIYYIIMEYLPDGDLRKKIKEFQEKGQLLPPELLHDWMQQLASGLSAINELLIHRDLKPKNVLFSSDTLKISDFGLSKYVEEATREHTFKGEGTYPYMAPETWLLAHQSVCTDIYSLGIMFYELSTLSLPFKAENWLEWREKHLYELPPHPIAENKHINLNLDGMILRMMEKEPSNRYQFVQEVIAVLRQASAAQPGGEERDIAVIVSKARERYDREREKEKRRKLEEEMEEERSEKAYLGYEELVRLFDGLAEEINMRLQVTQIAIRDDNGRAYVQQRANRNYFYYDDALVLGFFRIREVLEKFRKPDLIRNNGLIGAAYFFVQKGHGIDNIREGANLLLLMRPGKMYGEWNICEIRDNPVSRHQHAYQPFAVENIDTLIEDLSWHWRGAMHTHIVSVKTLQKEDLKPYFEKLVA